MSQHRNLRVWGQGGYGGGRPHSGAHLWVRGVMGGGGGPIAAPICGVGGVVGFCSPLLPLVLLVLMEHRETPAAVGRGETL